ncbi:MAG: hypothetical protein PVG08_20760 [Desulfobacterales bacterium]
MKIIIIGATGTIFNLPIFSLESNQASPKIPPNTILPLRLRESDFDT